MSEINIETQNKKKGLGRGLGSLLGGQSGMASSVQSTTTPQAIRVQAQQSTAASAPQQAEHGSADSKIWMIAIDKLVPGEYQPRTQFDKEKLSELAASIKENGILQPIVVRKRKAGGFEIIAGERRWRASQMAGMHEVPVIIKSYEDKQALELSIIENIQREDLNPIDEAEGYQRLISEFGLSQQEVADRVGKERATVANAVRLLNLTQEVREMLLLGAISAGHAKVILSCELASDQIKYAKKTVKEKLSVRKLEKIIAQSKLAPPLAIGIGKDDSMMEKLVLGLAEEMQKLMGTKVEITYSAGKGKISIQYYSNEELNNIVDQIRDGWRK